MNLIKRVLHNKILKFKGWQKFPAYFATKGGKQCLPEDKVIQEMCDDWLMTEDMCKKYMKALLDNLNRGLKKATHDKAVIKCFVTYVQDLPEGTERKRVMALDLGGTNFRVLLIELRGRDAPDIQQSKFRIPQDIMTGPGVNLFTHIAKNIMAFVKSHNLEKEVLPLGFTFSFPLQQKGLNKGLLDRWTKGFTCEGVVGQDVVQMLKDAMKKEGGKIDIRAILNDTTGTLMACAWVNTDCRIGLIAGTGTNACYVEKIKNAETFDGDPKGKPHVLINTEWGAFGDDGALDFLRNDADKELDSHSVNKGRQLQEKMVSGMYLGELTRLAMLKCICKGALFGGKAPEQLKKRGAFETRYVSEIETEQRGTITECMKILKKFGISNPTEKDCFNARFVCEMVTTRAAYMVGSGLSTLVNKIGNKTCTIGIDGSVYRFHPRFHHLLVNQMKKLVNKKHKFTVTLAQDGSGIGAAIVAAATDK